MKNYTKSLNSYFKQKTWEEENLKKMNKGIFEINHISRPIEWASYDGHCK